MAFVRSNIDSIKASFPELLQNSLGIVGTACQKAGISRQTYYRWREVDPKFAKKCDKVELVTGSMVKDQLLKKILENDITAIIFYCKTKLKHEGFVERIETTGKDGGAIEFARKLTDEERTLFEQRMQIERENLLREQQTQQLEMKVVSEQDHVLA